MCKGVVRMKKINYLMKKYLNWETFKYAAAGAISGGSNVCIYFALKNIFKLNYLASNFAAFAIGVVIAYFLNRKFVFPSPSKEGKEKAKEIFKFIGGRVFSCIADMGILYFLVDIIKMKSGIAKFVDSTIISVMNYFICKLLVFKA